MATAKLLMIFPRPADEPAFEQAYRDVHIPMIEANMKGMNRFVAARVIRAPGGQSKGYRIGEVHFSDLKALEACLETDKAAAVIEHARQISTGGPPIVLVCDEESFLFW